MSTNDKYDRQVRLWGPHGQALLRDASILLLGCDPSGVEAVKNLVLPGIGELTVVDHKMITQRDATNNFFTPFSLIGSPRAKVVQELLCELNPDVKGKYVIADPASFQILEYYSLVIVNEFCDHDAKVISQTCNKLQIRAIFLNTKGFIGKLRLQANDHFVIESKPLGEKMDLRVAYPFKELAQYFDSLDLQQLAKDQDVLAHVPYIVLQRKALDKYLTQYGMKHPKTFNEKQEIFPKLIRELGQLLPSEYRGNFIEALENIHQSFVDNRLVQGSSDQAVQDLLTLLADKRAIDPPQNVFWVLLCALSQFARQDPNGQPPLPRMFPDMKSTTETYIQLKQQIYGKKIEEDFVTFKSIVSNIQNKKQYGIVIGDEQIRIFIDNILNIKVVNFRPYYEELENPLKVEDYETDLYKWYIGLQACQNYFEKHRSQPTLDNIQDLNNQVQKVSQLLGVQDVEITISQELCRYDECKLHYLGSTIGGIASQEAVKLITKQFVPINNTLIYNGLTGEAGVYEF